MTEDKQEEGGILLNFPPAIEAIISQGYSKASSNQYTLGEWEALCLALTQPPRTTFVRMNPLAFPPGQAGKDQAFTTLQSAITLQCQHKGWPMESLKVQSLPQLPDVFVIQGSGPHVIDSSSSSSSSDLLSNKEKQKQSPEHEDPALQVIVDMMCGNAVLRGADIYAAGILGTHGPGSLKPGLCVSIMVDLDGKCTRASRSYTGAKLYIGHGISQVSRDDLYSSLSTLNTAGGGRGIGILMTDPLYRAPCLSDLFSQGLILQNLPSILVCHALDPQPGEVILDMCAAPGGKTTHLAALSQNRALIIALERSRGKVERMCQYVNTSGLTSIHTYVCDSTNCVAPKDTDGGNEAGKCGPILQLDALPPPASRVNYLPRESFDRILLDGPCSALGQRPCFNFKATRATLGLIMHHPLYQRQLLHSAAKLLRPGGRLVYSTCTFTIAENEANVAYALHAFPELALCHVEPHIRVFALPGRKFDETAVPEIRNEDGSTVLLALSEEDRLKCCRFEPAEPLGYLSDGKDGTDQPLESIGFFFACFRKRMNCLD